jgi:surface protein
MNRVAEKSIENSMFLGADSANPDTSNWDTSKVTIMQAMFIGATSFKRSLANFKLDNLTNAINMLKDTNINVTGTTNLDATLVAWAAYTPKNTEVAFHTGDAQYSATGETALNTLVDDFGWVITAPGGLAT